MKQLLLIDSEDGTADLLREACALSPWLSADILTATTDAEALPLLEQAGDHIGLVMVSIDGGNITGPGLFRSVERRDLRVPRIALTCGDDIETVRTALREGAVDFLTRPLNVADAIATIDRVMSDTERRRRNWRERSDYSALMREVEIAAKMQQQILPTRFPRDGAIEVHGAMRPAKIMGGDFYDVFKLDDHRIGFAIGDVAGKSVPAAFYMAVARTLLRSAADAHASPAACMATVDRLLSDYDIPGIFVTAFLGILDTRSNLITYANAGHCLPYIGDNDGNLRELEGGRSTVLGIGAGLTYEEDEVPLQPGEFLFLYTDGVTESISAAGHDFGNGSLEAWLRANCTVSAEQIGEGVLNAITDFAHGREQHDDLTCLVVRQHMQTIRS